MIEKLALFGWRPVDPPQRPVLLVNPRSGDGTAARLRLAERARDVGIEVVILTQGDDCQELVRAAVESGADALGMAGGDGSLAVVAAAAAAHGLPFICVPAGTRNHFALDLGVDRKDVLGALDAFTDAVERRVDLAEVNGRPFLNNVSLGIYGEAVRRAAYRDAKVRTLVETAEKVLAPHGQAPALRLVDDAGRQHDQPAVVLVSNNPYSLDRPPPGTRPGWMVADWASSFSTHRITAPPSGAGLERTAPGRVRPGAGVCRHRRGGGGARPAAAFRDPGEGAAGPDLEPPSWRLTVSDPGAPHAAAAQAAAPGVLARSAEKANLRCGDSRHCSHLRQGRRRVRPNLTAALGEGEGVRAIGSVGTSGRGRGRRRS